MGRLSQTRQWELQDIQGDQIIFVSFRDQAGNIARASATVRYDTIAPIPSIATDAPLPCPNIANTHKYYL
jgi:hypothetical protein